MKKRAIGLLLGCLVGLGGCAGDGTTLGPDGRPLGEDEGNGDPVVVVTLAQLSEEIFSPRCATSGCHAAGSGAGSLVLEADPNDPNGPLARIAEQIIDIESAQQSELKRIDPGNPLDSYLLRKVEGRDISGDQMPLTGNLLTDEQIGQIRLWIEAGAPLE